MRLYPFLLRSLHESLTPLREPGLALALLVFLLAGVVAYAVPYSYTLDIGALPGVLTYDRPYLVAGFNDVEGAPEYDISDAPTRAFRWAFEDARMLFPSIGRATRAATLQVVAGQPSADPVPSSWSVSDQPLLTLPLASAARAYHVLLPAHDSDLDLRIHTPPFQPPNDPRLLAFAVDNLSLTPLSFTTPAFTSLLWLGGCILLGVLLLRQSGLPPWLVFVFALVVAVAMALLLASQRLGLTTFAPRLFSVLLAALALALPLRLVCADGAHRLGMQAPAREIAAVIGLVMLAWTLRLGGLLHPQAYTSDLGLNANNLRQVITGDLIFTEDLPGEAGGGPAPYPPGQYLTLLPLGLLLGPERLLQAGNTFADSLMIVWGWLLLRSSGATAHAALFAGALYLFATPLLVSLSIGEMANVWGQALLGPLALLIAYWRRRYDQPTARRFSLPWLLTAGLALALLGHFGVFLSLLLFCAVYFAALLLDRGPWFAWAVAVAVALLAVTLFYYSAHAALLLNRSTSNEAVFGVARMRHELSIALEWMGRTGPLHVALGAAGLALLALEGRNTHDLWILLAAWCASALLSLASLLWLEQAVRWQHFLFPALVWCGGFALAALARRGRIGRLLAGSLLALIILRGAVLWYTQLLTYQH